MENSYYNKNENHQMRERRGSGSFLGVMLIIAGLLWLLKETGWYHMGLTGWHTVSGFLKGFHFGTWSGSWPVVLLVVGIVLVSGRRILGVLLIFLALLLFLPGLVIPGIVAILLFPVLLVIAGIILISRML